MPDKRKIYGFRGEDLASLFLKDRGYLIISRNFTCKIGEIDIICSKDDSLCFVEVKTRKNLSYGLPCEAVNYRKQCKIRCVAEFFILSNPEYSCLSPRFDVIEILTLSDKKYIRHTQSAF